MIRCLFDKVVFFLPFTLINTGSIQLNTNNQRIKKKHVNRKSSNVTCINQVVVLDEKNGYKYLFFVVCIIYTFSG